MTTISKIAGTDPQLAGQVVETTRAQQTKAPQHSDREVQSSLTTNGKKNPLIAKSTSEIVDIQDEEKIGELIKKALI